MPRITDIQITGKFLHSTLVKYYLNCILSPAQKYHFVCYWRSKYGPYHTAYNREKWEICDKTLFSFNSSRIYMYE